MFFKVKQIIVLRQGTLLKVCQFKIGVYSPVLTDKKFLPFQRKKFIPHKFWGYWLVLVPKNAKGARMTF